MTRCKCCAATLARMKQGSQLAFLCRRRDYVADDRVTIMTWIRAPNKAINIVERRNSRISAADMLVAIAGASMRNLGVTPGAAMRRVSQSGVVPFSQAPASSSLATPSASSTHAASSPAPAPTLSAAPAAVPAATVPPTAAKSGTGSSAASSGTLSSSGSSGSEASGTTASVGSGSSGASGSGSAIGGTTMSGDDVVASMLRPGCAYARSLLTPVPIDQVAPDPAAAAPSDGCPFLKPALSNAASGAAAGMGKRQKSASFENTDESNAEGGGGRRRSVSSRVAPLDVDVRGPSASGSNAGSNGGGSNGGSDDDGSDNVSSGAESDEDRDADGRKKTSVASSSHSKSAGGLFHKAMQEDAKKMEGGLLLLCRVLVLVSVSIVVITSVIFTMDASTVAYSVTVDNIQRRQGDQPVLMTVRAVCVVVCC